ncbi:MAG: response regulator, partial [Cyanobacteria bacterium]|nr:response regulator [Cyanobacteriota bacterium]
MGKKILIVDKDPQFRKLIVPIFESRGHAVLQAENGAEGTRVLGAERPDLVIIGSPLPDRSSSEIISEIRERERSLDLVFIASDKAELQELRPRLKEWNVAISASKPLIPFVFGARVECQFSGADAEAQQRKLKDFETM